jgi:hypothetical protein
LTILLVFFAGAIVLWVREDWRQGLQSWARGVPPLSAADRVVALPRRDDTMARSLLPPEATARILSVLRARRVVSIGNVCAISRADGKDCLGVAISVEVSWSPVEQVFHTNLVLCRNRGEGWNRADIYRPARPFDELFTEKSPDFERDLGPPVLTAPPAFREKSRTDVWWVVAPPRLQGVSG